MSNARYPEWQLEAAEALIDRYVERFPRDLEFYGNKVSDYVWVVSGEKAAAVGAEGLRDHPTNDGVAYQIHRAFLMNGQVEDARRLETRMRGSSELPPSSILVVQMRQACAEGNDKLANQIVEQILADPTAEVASRWLSLQTVGRYDEANALITSMDNPDEAVALASFLTYYHFDISRFPYLESLLARDRRVSHRGRMRDERLDAAETLGQTHHFETVEEARRAVVRADVEGDHGAEAAGLTFLDVASRVSGEPRVEDRLDSRVRGEVLGHAAPVLFVSLHPDG